MMGITYTQSQVEAKLDDQRKEIYAMYDEKMKALKLEMEGKTQLANNEKDTLKSEYEKQIVSLNHSISLLQEKLDQDESRIKLLNDTHQNQDQEQIKQFNLQIASMQANVDQEKAEI